MYVAQHFELPEDYTRRLLTSPRRGNLVTVHDHGPEATLVPFYYDDAAGALVTHLVRNNPQAAEPLAQPTGLVILDEADAYVSPSMYATNAVMPNVPTWDYITLHVSGRVRVDPSPDAALEAAVRLTEAMGDGGTLSAVGQDKLQRMSRAIVAVSVEATTVRGKAKMSQNRHPDDVRGLIAAMEAQGEERLARYLREVSLPYAEERFATITRLRGARRAVAGPGLAR
ncbi:FMN-binding negative transcriptional regulator [Actinomyces marmotae]|uniref:FMN-binding negative transcriptional regulator n=1 Tax=Actinomyces marmotae TaxID=2737173 RepID=A0A6M8B955_9ACTO|nr:FMN-binding negative transcriptional regulator [Actinomyces marmotae]QKD79763.1 FMN-binding negative transcriptional regulator [Actinomyces marmotae]